MQYLKSHRDQKCRPCATKAIQSGCNILEIDIQQAMGKIVLGHNLRPKFPFFFDCTLEDYMEKVPFGVIVQLDVKEICFTEWGRKRFAERIKKVLEPYRRTNKFILSANEGFCRVQTKDTLTSQMAFSGYDYESWETFSKNNNVETVDLW